MRPGWTVLLTAATAFSANPPVGGTLLVEPGTPEARRFSGIGQMGGCTVFLIKPPGAAAESPAYVMTAGHCIDLAANDVIIGRPDTARTVRFAPLKTPGGPAVQTRSRRIVYSTMKEIDIALVELDATLGALESQGAAPLGLAAAVPRARTAVEWAGVPTAGVPTDERVLRTGTCETSGAVDVLEWRWSWRGQIRHDCSDISGGASGSPLIDRAAGTVLGVIGTTNVGNSEPTSDGLCGRNDPCELRGADTVWLRNSSYATPIVAAVGCFDASGVFTLAAPACGLDPGIQASILEQRLSAKPGASWNVAVSSNTQRFFRYKTFAQGAGDCRDERGYGPPEPIPGRVTAPLPETEGRYFVCVLAGVSPTPDASWQQPRFASVAPLRVDGTPPADPPRFNLYQESNGFAFVPSSSLSTGIIVKTEDTETSGCADQSTYRRIYPVPWFIAKSSARRLCLFVEDGAGNAGRPYEIDLTRPSIFPEGVFSSAGYRAGRAAPGSWISIFGIHLDGAAISVRTAAGEQTPLETVFSSEGQLNALLPESVPTGEALLVVAPPDRQPTRAALTIAPAVPGIFTVDGRPTTFGVIHGVLSDGSTQPAMTCGSRGCEAHPFENVREFLIAVGGLGNLRAISATFAEQPVDVLAVEPGPAPGSQWVRVRMPAGLRLRGYIPVRIGVRGAESGPAYLWLR